MPQLRAAQSELLQSRKREAADAPARRCHSASIAIGRRVMRRISILAIAVCGIFAVATLPTPADAQRSGGGQGGGMRAGGGAPMGGGMRMGGAPSGGMRMGAPSGGMRMAPSGGMRMGAAPSGGARFSAAPAAGMRMAPAGARMSGGAIGPRGNVIGPRMGPRMAGPRMGAPRMAALQDGVVRGSNWQGANWQGKNWRSADWRRGGRHGHRPFRRSFAVVGFPAFYGAYAYDYPYYDAAYYDDCYQVIRLGTPWGRR